MINNSDGTVSFEDATVYSQKGSEFGAKEVNEEREAINQLITDLYPIAYCKSFSTQVTLAANGRTDFGITIAADEGYKYMGIANIDYSGSTSHLAIGKWSVVGNTCYISMQNLNNTQTTVTVTINAMFIRSACLR